MESSILKQNMKRIIQGVVKFLVLFFQANPFLANIKRCPNFLDYALDSCCLGEGPTSDLRGTQAITIYWFYLLQTYVDLSTKSKSFVTSLYVHKLQFISNKLRSSWNSHGQLLEVFFPFSCRRSHYFETSHQIICRTRNLI